MNKTTIIFDLDGVLLSERPYWTITSLTVQSLLRIINLSCAADETDVAAEGIVPPSLIDQLKGRGVNSNWDLALVILTAALADCFNQQTDAAKEKIEECLSAFSEDISTLWYKWVEAWHPVVSHHAAQHAMMESFWVALGQNTGHAVMEQWVKFLTRECPALRPVWSHPDLRDFVIEEFQNQISSNPLGAAATVDKTALCEALRRLQKHQVSLGIATGRIDSEARLALNALGILDFFSPDRFITYDHVTQAEQNVKQAPLGKPHPYIVLQAAFPERLASEICDTTFINQPRPWLIYVGDAGSDVLAARTAGAQAWMVLTGCASPAFAAQREKQLQALQADKIFPNVIDLITELCEVLS